MKEKHYEISMGETEKGFYVKGRNDGFSAIEILGFLDWKRQDILDQLAGKIKPTIVAIKYVLFLTK